MLRIYAGYDETCVWQEFGEMKFQTRDDVPQEWGNPENPNQYEHAILSGQVGKRVPISGAIHLLSMVNAQARYVMKSHTPHFVSAITTTIPTCSHIVV